MPLVRLFIHKVLKICLANEHSLELGLTIAEVRSASVPQILLGGIEVGRVLISGENSWQEQPLPPANCSPR